MPYAGSWNATQSSVVGSSVDGGVVLALLVIMATVILGFILLTSIERYTKFFETIGWLLTTIKYALYGVGVVSILAAVWSVCSMVVAIGGGVGFKPEWVVYAIGGYIGLSILGWGAEKVVSRAANMHAQYVESKAMVEEPTAP